MTYVCVLGATPFAELEALEDLPPIARAVLVNDRACLLFQLFTWTKISLAIVKLRSIRRLMAFKRPTGGHSVGC